MNFLIFPVTKFTSPPVLLHICSVHILTMGTTESTQLNRIVVMKIFGGVFGSLNIYRYNVHSLNYSIHNDNFDRGKSPVFAFIPFFFLDFS